MVSCNQEEILDNENLNDIPFYVVDEDAYEEFLAAEIDLNYDQIKPSFHTDHTPLIRFKDFSDFEKAIELKAYEASKSNQILPVHKNLSEVDFQYVTPELLTFLNHDNQIIIGSELMEIQGDQYVSTNLNSGLKKTEPLVAFESESGGLTTRDPASYVYKTIALSTSQSGNYTYYMSQGNLPYTGTGFVTKLEVECMQRVYSVFGARRGKSETNLSAVWTTNEGKVNILSNYTPSPIYAEGEFERDAVCAKGFTFRAEVYNPRDNDYSGYECHTACAVCKRKKNTGVSSRHIVRNYNSSLPNGIIMNFYRS